jgi:hypothetical protein
MFILAYSIFLFAYQYHGTDMSRASIRRLASVVQRTLERLGLANGSGPTFRRHSAPEYEGSANND